MDPSVQVLCVHRDGVWTSRYPWISNDALNGYYYYDAE